MARAKSPWVKVGNTAPTVPVRRVASAFAAPSGTQPRCRTTEATRARNSSDTVSGLFIARETVAVETPATRATSRRRTARTGERAEALDRFLRRVSVNRSVLALRESRHIAADGCRVQPRRRAVLRRSRVGGE